MAIDSEIKTLNFIFRLVKGLERNLFEVDIMSNT